MDGAHRMQCGRKAGGARLPRRRGARYGNAARALSTRGRALRSYVG